MLVFIQFNFYDDVNDDVFLELILF